MSDQMSVEKNLSRRTMLKAMGGAGLGLGLLRGCAISEDAAVYFTHGVASGDPLSDRVILWTRVVPASGEGPVRLVCEIAEDQGFKTVVRTADASTNASRDYIVKLDMDGLKPGVTYFYRFVAEGITSMVGKTRTLAEGSPEAVKFAVVSCSNFPQGQFHVYGELAKRDFDAVLHLGDYIYEYEAGKYDNPAAVQAGRAVQPAHEILSLEDYRMRYGLYRTDPNLQAVHAAHPFICVWDDHEIANDTWDGGAENHNEGEGAFSARKAAALRAYREWLPVRDPADDQPYDVSYRGFRFGDLVHLLMLDTRLVGRTKGLDYQRDLPPVEIPFDFSDPENPRALLSADVVAAAPVAAVKSIAVPFDMRGARPVPMTDWQEIKGLDPKTLPEGYQYLPDLKRFSTDVLADDSRTILGEVQETWVSDQLQSEQGQALWQVFGQQVLMGKINMPMLVADDFDFNKSSYVGPDIVGRLQALAKAGMPFNLDAWDGYPAARNRLLADIDAAGANAIVLAGDTHNAWASEITLEGKPVAVEMATPGVSSPGLETYLPIEPSRLKEAFMTASPELKFTQTSKRGWLELAITRTEATGHWYFVSDILADNYQVLKGGEAQVEAGAHKLAVTDMGLV